MASRWLKDPYILHIHLVNFPWPPLLAKPAQHLYLGPRRGGRVCLENLLLLWRTVCSWQCKTLTGGYAVSMEIFQVPKPSIYRVCWARSSEPKIDALESHGKSHRDFLVCIICGLSVAEGKVFTSCCLLFLCCWVLHQALGQGGQQEHPSALGLHSLVLLQGTVGFARAGEWPSRAGRGHLCCLQKGFLWD